jgi:hypothetical protein
MTRTERSEMRKTPLKSARRRACGRHGQASGLPTPLTGEQNQKKRTIHVLPKPDNFIRYRQTSSSDRNYRPSPSLRTASIQKQIACVPDSKLVRFTVNVDWRGAPTPSCLKKRGQVSRLEGCSRRRRPDRRILERPSRPLRGASGRGPCDEMRRTSESGH